MTKHRQSLSATKKLLLAHLGLFTLEGIYTVFTLVSEPSQSGGFLGFSIGRWAFLFFNLLALIGMLYLLYKVWNDQGGNLESWLTSESNQYNLFFLCLLLFGFSAPSALGKIPAIRYFPYFGRIQPSLTWLALASGQVWLTLLILLRESMLRWLRQFFPIETSHGEGSSPNRTQRLALLGIALVYVTLQIISFIQVREAHWLPDSIDYIFPGKKYAWNELGLWAHTKPWGTTVFYKLTGSSPIVIDAVQTLLSSIAWLALGWSFVHILNSYKFRVPVFGLLLVFSLTPPIQMWNHIIQSESLSISLMVLILAVWLSLIQHWRWEKLLLLVFLFAWWIGTRETNVYLSLMIAGILVLVGVLYKQQRFYWAVSLLLALFCYINMQISEVPSLPRWLYPMTNTLLNRIVPNEEYLSYFQGHGLPVSTELLALSGGWANSSDFAVYNDPALNDVESWLYRKGKNIYIQFLISHPVYTLTDPWIHINAQLEPADLPSYAPAEYRPAIGALLGGLFFPNALWLVALLLVATLTLMVITKPWKDSPVFWIFFFALILFIPHFYIIWHGDAAEVGRHAIQASIQLRLSLWLLFFQSLDKIRLNGKRIRTHHRS